LHESAHEIISVEFHFGLGYFFEGAEIIFFVAKVLLSLSRRFIKVAKSIIIIILNFRFTFFLIKGIEITKSIILWLSLCWLVFCLIKITKIAKSVIFRLFFLFLFWFLFLIFKVSEPILAVILRSHLHLCWFLIFLIFKDISWFWLIRSISHQVGERVIFEGLNVYCFFVFKYLWAFWFDNLLFHINLGFWFG
jgi:hypothetical protein